MGRQQDPDLSLTSNPAKKGRRFLRAARVEAGERLIEEQELRPGRQSVRDQDSLLFAPGQGPDPGIGEVGGVDGSEKLVDPGALGARHYREAQPSPVHPELDEVPCTYRKIRVEDYLLGHITDRAPSEMPTRHSHLARRDRQEPENRPQQGRLPGPVSPMRPVSDPAATENDTPRRSRDRSTRPRGP